MIFIPRGMLIEGGIYMDWMKIAQYTCSFFATVCVGITYIQMSKQSKKQKNKPKER